MSRRRRRRRNNNVFIIVSLVLGIVILVLLILLLTTLNGKNNKPKPLNNSTSIEQQSQTKEDATKDNTTEPDTKVPATEDASETEEAPTQEETNSPQETLPEKNYGKWNLTELPTDEIPFGNDKDQVTAAGIPTGVFWYGNKWGQYKVDFISEMGKKYNEGQTTEKVIYLTMDCGFDNEHTGPILDILKEKNVKATFFVTTMFYDARPDLIQRMINEGHRIGSHSINHKNMTKLSLEEQEKEIMDVVNKLKKDYNYDCRLFRYPEGLFSEQSLGLVENLGLKSVFWSYAYNDYSTTQPEVQPSLDAAVKYLHPGAIYLLHASSSTNRAFLGQWIDAARAAGYEFAGVYPVD